MKKCDCPQRLVHQVTIVDPTYSPDANSNEPIPAWTGIHAKRRAFCRAMTSREVSQSEQILGSVGWIVELAYDPKTVAITSDMRLILHSFGDRIVYCDGPSMPLNGEKRRVQVRGMEKTG
jgi:hypothetical protein